LALLNDLRERHDAGYQKLIEESAKLSSVVYLFDRLALIGMLKTQHHLAA
jgi:hypothetical protein